MGEKKSRSKWIALSTGFFSILICFFYLLLITLLDSRGAMLPPPPEAFGEVVAVYDVFSVMGLQIY